MNARILRETRRVTAMRAEKVGAPLESSEMGGVHFDQAARVSELPKKGRRAR